MIEQPEVLLLIFSLAALVAMIIVRLSRNRTATLVLQEFSITVEPRDIPGATVEIHKAKIAAQSGQHEKVVAILQDIVRRCPDTHNAERARHTLKKKGL